MMLILSLRLPASDAHIFGYNAGLYIQLSLNWSSVSAAQTRCCLSGFPPIQSP